MTNPPTPTARRALAVLAAAWAAFTVYGSLVPFHHRPRPWAEARAEFANAMRQPVRVDSRSDAVANVLLGGPLGFGLLGAVTADRRLTAGGVALRGLALMPACVVFAAAVEFSQVYFPPRNCSNMDVLCQALGAGLGMAVWIAAGQRLTDHARVVWSGSNLRGTPGRLLAAYLALLVAVQVLPLDLNPSPKDVYKKLRDTVVYVPFEEFRGADNAATWSRAARALQVFGLYLPAGLLAARLPGRFWEIGNFPRLFGLAVALAAVLEGLQLWVTSRTPSATDVVVGTAGTVAGALLGWCRHRDLSISDVLGLGSWWLLLVGVISWEPFPPRVADPPRPFDWVPGMPLENGFPLFAVEQMLTKLVLFGAGGAIAAGATAGASPARRLTAAAVAGLVVSAVLEAGQTRLGSHTPCITDVLLGGLGALCGAGVWGVLNPRGEPSGAR